MTPKKGELTGLVYLMDGAFVSVRIGMQRDDGRYLMYWTDHDGKVNHYTNHDGHYWSEQSIKNHIDGWRLDETSVVQKLLDEYET